MASFSGSRFAACPICGNEFHRQLLARHAARCGVSPVALVPKQSPSKTLAPALAAPGNVAGNVGNTNADSKASSSSSALALIAPAPAAAANKATKKRTRASAFGSLRPPGPKDIRPSRRRRGLDAPDQEFTHLIVLDFEWTADNKARMLPHPEIIEWSCVLVNMTPRPARIVSELQLYVKPEHNPVLTTFSKELTAISQAQVDAGCSLREAIATFEQWMKAHGLLVVANNTTSNANTSPSKLNYAIVTWSDSDLGSTLSTQMRALEIPRRPHFDAWINLKIAYERVYKKSSRGLQRCVEAIGLRFDGRAHSGLVDSINTARIVLDMVNRQNFRGFCRTTRFLTPDWEMVGSRRAKAREQLSAAAPKEGILKKKEKTAS